MDCEIFSPCAAAALYRLSALKEVEGFDEDFFCYAEDVDLGFRLRLAGWLAIYVPDAVVSHVGGSTTGGRHSNFSLYHGHRNLVWTFVKNMPSFLFWIFLPAHIFLNLISLLWFSFHGRGRIIFKAKIDAIKGLRSQIHKRAETQRMRKVKLFTIFNILNKGFIK
jgi:GT2 family glycosyltransferase